METNKRIFYSNCTTIVYQLIPLPEELLEWSQKDDDIDQSLHLFKLISHSLEYFAALKKVLLN